MTCDPIVGVDITSVDRIARLSQRRPSFVDKLFTVEEAEYCAGRPERLAARWAAKEAVRKVYGSCGLPIPTYPSIAVRHRPGGAPEVLVGGHSVGGLEISLSHDAGLAVAVAILAGSATRLDEANFPAHMALPERPDTGHKGTFGTALVLAGSPGFPGAAVLACRGALRGGAGKVKAVVAAGGVVDGFPAEVIRVPVPGVGSGFNSGSAQTIAEEVVAAEAVVCGPGLGAGDGIRGFMTVVMGLMKDRGTHLVLDADALNAISRWEELRGLVPPGCVMTPHPLEAARLARRELASIQEDRQASALTLAGEFDACVVLKGPASVVGDSSGRTWTDGHATSVLSAGGTGDVLAGLLGALLAQGSSPFLAAQAAVYLHGEAGRRLAHSRGRAGILASEVADALVEVQEAARQHLERRGQP